MCSRKKNNYSFDMNSKSSTPSQINFVTDARENFEQFQYLLTYFPKLNLKFGILFIAVIGESYYLKQNCWKILLNSIGYLLFLANTIYCLYNMF